MKTGLSILIPTTPDRKDFLSALKDQFDEQLGAKKCEFVPIQTLPGILQWAWIYRGVVFDIEILCYEDQKQHSIGEKRNWLLQNAMGDNVAFLDSDDRIGPNYFQRILDGIRAGVDCCSLKGIITEDGKNPLIFEHSIRYDCYKTNPDHMPVRYERFPNHLKCIKASIAKKFKFPDQNHGEDTDWAVQIDNSGLINTEHYIEEIIYMYDYRSKK